MQAQTKCLTKTDFREMSTDQLVEACRTVAYRRLAVMELRNRGLDPAQLVRERNPLPETVLSPQKRDYRT